MGDDHTYLAEARRRLRSSAPRRTVPIDPDSPRGRELARALTLLLDEFEENIAARKRVAEQSERAA